MRVFMVKSTRILPSDVHYHIVFLVKVGDILNTTQFSVLPFLSAAFLAGI